MDPSPSTSANAPTEELKVRARVRLNQARKADDSEAKLRDYLNEVAREVGFAHWEHARQVLGGLAATGDDLGSFWHAPRTGILLNEWFAHYEQAQAALARQRAAFLLPYKRQFMVVQADFVRELGVDPADPAWDAIGHDAVRGYGTPAWQQLAWQRVRAPRETFA